MKNGPKTASWIGDQFCPGPRSYRHGQHLCMFISMIVQWSGTHGHGAELLPGALCVYFLEESQWEWHIWNPVGIQSLGWNTGFSVSREYFWNATENRGKKTFFGNSENICRRIWVEFKEFKGRNFQRVLIRDLCLYVRTRPAPSAQPALSWAGWAHPRGAEHPQNAPFKAIHLMVVSYRPVDTVGVTNAPQQPTWRELEKHFQKLLIH